MTHKTQSHVKVPRRAQDFVYHCLSGFLLPRGKHEWQPSDFYRNHTGLILKELLSLSVQFIIIMYYNWMTHYIKISLLIVPEVGKFKIKGMADLIFDEGPLCSS